MQQLTSDRITTDEVRSNKLQGFKRKKKKKTANNQQPPEAGKMLLI